MEGLASKHKKAARLRAAFVRYFRYFFGVVAGAAAGLGAAAFAGAAMPD